MISTIFHRAKAETVTILKEVGQGSSKRTALSPKQHPCTSLQGLDLYSAVTKVVQSKATAPACC